MHALPGVSLFTKTWQALGAQWNTRTTLVLSKPGIPDVMLLFEDGRSSAFLYIMTAGYAAAGIACNWVGHEYYNRESLRFYS